ncbi:hypothetical protein ATO8_19399 [Roseivivax marinus]|uniref:Uncharacterized protein n=1 Tax=Roseivivax marinus TaxID=1379903 RepID=W4HE86_9RHOB|nr:hypothetical protein [Roseivivax marinus]ETW11019.1 hypothetical protein ATO8_19399 [Roseivivax marinus]
MPVDPLLYQVPQKLLEGYGLGKYELFNAILKDTATGKIVGHVQQTQVLNKAVGSMFGGTVNTVLDGFSPLSVVSAVQNQQIIGQLRKIQDSLGLLQNLQIGGLALSGANLGVCAVGFAVMLKRLNAISGRIEALGAQVEKVTADRRQDELNMILADVRSALLNVDSLAARRDPVPVALDLQLELDRCASRLSSRLRQVVGQKALEAADLDLMWTIAGAIRLCHEAGDRALFIAEELEVAALRASRQSSELLQLSGELSADVLARRISQSAEDRTASRRAVLPQARLLVGSVQEAVASLAGQESLTRSLLSHGSSGRAYLETVAQEKQEPILFLPEPGSAIAA